MNTRLSRHESAFCLAANRWGHRNGVRRFFALVSRLGDGVAWYSLMALIVLLDGWSGLAASAHEAMAKSAMRTAGNQLGKKLLRGVLGSLMK